jgi:UDP-N-acetylmuramate--alanine ligase
MSALASFLLLQGYSVCGFDDFSSERIDDLRNLHISVFLPRDEQKLLEHILTSNVVVYTDAISKTHFAYAFAHQNGKKLISRAELLGTISASFPHSVAISGSHGKTTCTSMCAHILKETGVPFTAHIGGMDGELGNFYSNGEEFFLTEACEYKKNLLNIPCESAVILNIDADHMECYENEEDLKNTFYMFGRSAKRTFVCADDKNCASFDSFSTFGIANEFSDYRAINLKEVGQKYRFTIQEYGKDLCKVQLNVRGICNVYNALAAFAVMRSYGFSGDEIVRGLESFSFVKRRFEELGEYRGVSFVCDYAHHPREIMSTISTARGICAGKLYVVFQPHTYSRTKLLMQEFVEVLREIEELIVYKTYAAREYYDEEGSARTLAENVGGCLYLENMRELKSWIKRTVKAGDMILFLGAGDVYYVAERILFSLNKRKK